MIIWNGSLSRSIKLLSNNINQIHNIYHMHLLYFCYMFLCYIDHHQGDLMRPLLKNT